jgi:hypothetical protein
LEDQFLNPYRIGPYRRSYHDFKNDFNSDEEDFLNDSEPLKITERKRTRNAPVGLQNMGNT